MICLNSASTADGSAINLTAKPLLQVKDLQVKFKVHDGIIHAVNGLSFKINAGEIVGIVGESGCGKSQTMLALMGLLTKNSQVSGSVKFMGQELLTLTEKQLNQIRGKHIAMIFQDPMTSLNPYLKISTQMTEVLITHHGKSYKAALIESAQMLERVKIPDSKTRLHHYPHEFSGGMRQRVMIAMSLLTRPQLLIADEPTTALDVTVQAQILELLQELRHELGMAIIFITHDLGVVANLCDKVKVLYGGWLMETATTTTLFQQAQHPYTKALLDTIPKLDSRANKLHTIPGETPNLLNLAPGCPFQNRCSKVSSSCSSSVPLQQITPHHVIKCTYLAETLK